MCVHEYVFVYIYMCVCVCVCVLKKTYRLQKMILFI